MAMIVREKDRKALTDAWRVDEWQGRPPFQFLGGLQVKPAPEW